MSDGTAEAERANPIPILLALVVTVCAVFVAGAVGGIFAVAVGPFVDAGALVRFGLPVADAVRDLTAATTIGLLVLAATVVPESRTTRRRMVAARLAAVTGLTWAVAGLVSLVLSFAEVSGVPLDATGFAAELIASVGPLEPFRVAAISAGLALLVAAGSAVVRTRAAMVWLAAGSVVAVLPRALSGHAAGTAAHDTAVSSLAVHLVASALWVGGLLALVVLRPVLGPALGVSAARYSTIAGWCFAAVAVSGTVGAWVRLGGLGGVATAYGALLLLKVTALVLLGLGGWQHRRRVLPALTDSGHETTQRDWAAFGRLASVEVVVMAAAFGIAVALSRTAPPVPDTPVPVTPVLSLTGYPAPEGPLAGTGWWTVWRVDLLWLSVALLAVGLYAAGVLRLHRRGDRWPALRTIWWVLGWSVFVWVTCGATGVYGRLQFSVHMVMHMTLSMLVPILLVLAAPVTLALRGLPSRRDNTWGPRELLLGLVHSRLLRVLGNPVVAAMLFFGSLIAFYYTGLFELALGTHTGHVLMVVHFMLTGYLFAWVLIGVDPGPPRWPPSLRLLVLFATISLHAFFGVALTSQTTLLAPGYYELLDLPWPVDLVADQQQGGAIAWGLGEVPTLLLALLVTVAWLRQDAAETRRLDRQAERDDDAELRAYNAMLAARADAMRNERERPLRGG